MKNKSGFTLIELLMVISIIAVLSSITLASLNSARVKSRDARVLSNMNQISKALELYYDKYGKYPVTNEYGRNSTWCTWDSIDEVHGTISFLQPLIDEKFLSGKIESDGYSYRYSTNVCNNICNTTKAKYVLAVNGLAPNANYRNDCKNAYLWNSESCSAETGNDVVCIIRQ